MNLTTNTYATGLGRLELLNDVGLTCREQAFLGIGEQKGGESGIAHTPKWERRQVKRPSHSCPHMHKEVLEMWIKTTDGWLPVTDQSGAVLFDRDAAESGSRRRRAEAGADHERLKPHDSTEVAWKIVEATKVWHGGTPRRTCSTKEGSKPSPPHPRFPSCRGTFFR